MLKNASSTPSGRSTRVSWRARRSAEAPLQVIEDVPAENAVDGSCLLRKARVEEGREIFDLRLVQVPVDVLGEILDENLAAELLAEKCEVGADGRAEIEQHRLRAGAEPGQEPRERACWLDGRIERAGAGVVSVVVFAPPREEVGESHTLLGFAIGGWGW